MLSILYGLLLPAAGWEGPPVGSLHFQTVSLSRDRAANAGRCRFDIIDASWEHRAYRQLRYRFGRGTNTPDEIFASLGEQLLAGGVSDLPDGVCANVEALTDTVWRPGADEQIMYGYRPLADGQEFELHQVEYNDAVSLSSTFLVPNHHLGSWDTQGKRLPPFSVIASESPGARTETKRGLQIVTLPGKYWSIYYFRNGDLIGLITGLRAKVTLAKVVTSLVEVGGLRWPQETFSLKFSSPHASAALLREDIPKSEAGLRGLWKYSARVPHTVKIHAILAIDDESIGDRISAEVEVQDGVHVRDGRFGPRFIVYEHKYGRSRRELMSIVRDAQQGWPEDIRPEKKGHATAWYIALTIVIVGGIAGIRIIDVRRRKELRR